MDELVYLQFVESRIELIRSRTIGKKIWIYGAGWGGKLCLRCLVQNRIVVDGFYDQNWMYLNKVEGLEVGNIECADLNNDFIVVSTISQHEAITFKMVRMGFAVENILFIVPKEYLMSVEFDEEDIWYKGTKVGRFTYGYKSLIDSASGNNFIEEIGRFCSINAKAIVAVNNHSFDTVGTHPLICHPWKMNEEMLYKAEKYYGQKNLSIRIGNDVWIGANACILSGIKIGNGAVIAAGAVVTKDVEPYQIVSGVPAKLLKYRFDEETIRCLNKVKWWEWELKDIKKYLNMFDNVDEFIEKYKRMEEKNEQ